MAGGLRVEDAQSLEELREELVRRERELIAVHRITAALHARTSVDDLVRQTLRAAIETVDATAGSVLLRHPHRDTLVFCHVEGEDPARIERLTGREMPSDLGVAGAVFRSGKGMIVADAAREPCHYGEIDREIHYTTRTMIAVPLKTTRERTVGVMQVLNRREGEFDVQDLKVLEILSGQAASAIETAMLHAELLRVETERREFYREILRCVTGDKLQLVEHEEIPVEGRQLFEFPFDGPAAYAEMRNRLQDGAERAGMDEDRAADFVLAAGEAATNAVKHATRARCSAYLPSDRVVFRVADDGPGIRPENLPATILRAGYSTKVSLGMGYTVMLKLVDRVWLATGPQGTTLQLEKWLHPQREEEELMLTLLDRL